MKGYKVMSDEVDKFADAFGVRDKHKKRLSVVFDVLQAVFCFWRWFKEKDEKRDDKQD